MTQFKKGNNAGRGRPKGSKNKKIINKLPGSLVALAIEKLTQAVEAGEPWACQEVLKRSYAELKPITPDDSLDAEVISMKISSINDK